MQSEPVSHNDNFALTMPIKDLQNKSRESSSSAMHRQPKPSSTQINVNDCNKYEPRDDLHKSKSF